MEKAADFYQRLYFCGANGIRTRDPHTASVVRYQLRHSPERLNLSTTYLIRHLLQDTPPAIS